MTPEQAKVLADHLQSLMSEEDAADVAKWAANPEAVRYLLAQTPYAIPEHPETEDFQCRGCGEEEGRDRGHRRDCPVAAAWRALGDPRAADDIERAHGEALREVQFRAAIDRGMALRQRSANWDVRFVERGEATLPPPTCAIGATADGFRPCNLRLGHAGPCAWNPGAPGGPR